MMKMKILWHMSYKNMLLQCVHEANTVMESQKLPSVVISELSPVAHKCFGYRHLVQFPETLTILHHLFGQSGRHRLQSSTKINKIMFQQQPHGGTSELTTPPLWSPLHVLNELVHDGLGLGALLEDLNQVIWRP